MGQILRWSGESWKVVNDITINTISNFHGFETTNSSVTILTHRKYDAFIDYTSLLVTKRGLTGPLTVKYLLQHNIQKFERYVHITGGHLEPEKFFFEYLSPSKSLRNT